MRRLLAPEQITMMMIAMMINFFHFIHRSEIPSVTMLTKYIPVLQAPELERNAIEVSFVQMLDSAFAQIRKYKEEKVSEATDFMERAPQIKQTLEVRVTVMCTTLFLSVIFQWK